MRKIYFLFFAILTVFELHAQQDVIIPGRGNFGNGTVVNVDDKKAVDRIYLLENWSKGSLITSSNYSYDGLLLKYDLKDQLLVLKVDESNIQIVKSGLLNKFILTDVEGTQRDFMNAGGYKLDKQMMNGFVEIVADTDFTLAYKYAIRQKSVDNQSHYSTSSTGPVFTRQTTLLYAEKGSKEFVPITNKKDLIAIFKGKEAEMKLYIKKNVRASLHW